mgnify:CR=1 FL=1
MAGQELSDAAGAVAVPVHPHRRRLRRRGDEIQHDRRAAEMVDPLLADDRREFRVDQERLRLAVVEHKGDEVGIEADVVIFP